MDTSKKDMKSRVGIICQDDYTVVGHSLFKNFRLALQNILNTPFVEIASIDDLNNIDKLIIVDEHYIPHSHIWSNSAFVNKLNEQNIGVVVFNFEKIYNSKFPWNVEHQQRLELVNRYVQFVSDVDDAKILNKNITTKQLLSRDTVLPVTPCSRADKILFLGQCNPDWYPERYNLLKTLKEKINVEIKNSERKLSYEDFLQEMCSAKFILNPLGTGRFINLRFYEALNLSCVVLQQYVDEMEDFYSEELNHPSVIKFRTADELLEKINYAHSHIPFNYTLEDYFVKIDLKATIDIL